MSSDAKQRLAALSDEQRQQLARRLLASRGPASQGSETAPAGHAIPRRKNDLDLCPLSFAQSRIWFLNQLAPLSTAFLVGRPIRLRGPLDLDALARSLNEIVRRHESLRSVFPAVGGVPMQRVLPWLPRPLEVCDLGHVPADDRQATTFSQIRAEYERPWSLDSGPLLRTKLWRLADDDHVLLVVMHHIVSDGWSWGLMEAELTALYQAFRSGHPSPLRELPIQYPDFAVWQHAWVATDDYRRQIAYWKDLLTPLPNAQLLTNRNAVAQSSAGVVDNLVLPEELTRKVRALCRREGVTLFMALVAGFAALLSRYTGQDDIVIGSPIANRNRAELEDLIGCFMNPLPLRVDVGGNPSFAALLRRVRDLSLGVYANQDVPFDGLVRTLQPKRDPTTPPLFQVMLLLQNYPWQPLTLAGSEPERPDEFTERLNEFTFNTLHGDAVYPVAIEAYERGTTILCSFQYEPAFRTILARAPEHFLRLFEGATAEPDRAIGDLSMLTAEEERRLLSPRGSGDDRPAPLVHLRFEAQAARTPDAIAVVADDRSMTYRQLNARANQLAHHLRSRGVTLESRVAILLPRSPEMIVALLAVLKAGGAYVPLDPAYPLERLAFTLSDSGSALLLTTQAVIGELPGLLASAPAVTAIRLDVEARMLATLERTAPAGQPAGANLAYVIYTSGSTGAPKGVQITHEAIAAYVDVACDAFGLEASDRVLQFASISFDTAAEEIYPCLSRGAALVLRTDAMIESVVLFLRKCEEWGITILDLPTAYWHELTHVITRQALALPATVRLVILGGEQAHADAVRAWQARFGGRTRLLNTYGPTEATVVTTMHEVARPDPADAPLTEVPIGRPIPHARAYVLDRHLQPVTIGAAGELHLAGIGLSRGYLRRPDLTADKFVPNPFATHPGDRLYKTGDLARVLEDGTIEFLGRIDHQIKLRGYRIELTEIEAALRRDPGVEDAVVSLRDDTVGGKRIVAHVVAHSRAVTPGDLRRGLRNSLPDYMVPAAFVLLDSLPLTPSGKVDRDALPAPDEPRSDDNAFAAPLTAVQRTLTSIWQELLGVERLGIDDNFFDLGGHSLLLLRLHSRLHDAFAAAPSVVELFRFSTIRTLADQLSGRETDESLPDDELVLERADRQRQAFKRRREAVLGVVDVQ